MKTNIHKIVNLDLHQVVAVRNDRWGEKALITFRTDQEVD
jgi:hypothetical protein